MAAWRVILERRATLQEIETHWSVLDLADANDALDAWNEAHNQPRGRP